MDERFKCKAEIVEHIKYNMGNISLPQKQKNMEKITNWDNTKLMHS